MFCMFLSSKLMKLIVVSKKKLTIAKNKGQSFESFNLTNIILLKHNSTLYYLVINTV